MDAMPHTSSMWVAADASVRASAKHPFLLAMLDGTLAPTKFEYYIRQDSKYLLDFGLALRRLAALAGDEEEALALNNRRRRRYCGAEPPRLVLRGLGLGRRRPRQG